MVKKYSDVIILAIIFVFVGIGIDFYFDKLNSDIYKVEKYLKNESLK